MFRKYDCYEHTDAFVIEKPNGKKYLIFQTYYVGKICMKTNSEQGVDLYIEYLSNRFNSAEEELAFSFERIFKNNPGAVLFKICKFDSSKKRKFLDYLAWGFVNNRLYGIDDVHADQQGNAFFVYNDPPEVKLNSTTYEEMFYMLNNKIKSLRNNYSTEIDYVLNSIKQIMIETDKAIMQRNKK